MLLTLQDLAARWQCTVRTVYKIRRKWKARLPAIDLTKKRQSLRFRLVTVENFEIWLERGRKGKA